jgi:hypothetical protein
MLTRDQVSHHPSTCLALRVQDEGDDPFFDREVERAQLLEYLGSKPAGVLIVVGPRNSGKTRLLDEVLYGGATRLPPRRLPPIHIDARRRPITSSADLIFGLHGAADKWAATEPVKSVLGGAVTGVKKLLKTSLATLKVTANPLMVSVEVDANSPVKSGAAGEGQARITPVLEVYESAIEAARTSRPTEYPVIWIDEVSRSGQGTC